VLVIIPGLIAAGTVAFSPAALAVASVTPSPSPSPTSPSPTPSSSPSPSPTPSPTSPSPTPSPTAPTPTPSPTSPTPRPSPTRSSSPPPTPTPSPTPTASSKPPHEGRPAPSPSPSWPAGAPGPAPVWTSFAAHSGQAHAKKQHRATIALTAPAATRASTRTTVPLANIGGGQRQADGTGPGVVAACAALLAGFALLTGRWLRVSLRRRAHPPRHAHRTPAPSRGHRRLRRFEDDDWLF
jgi:hypothetical protein